VNIADAVQAQAGTDSRSIELVETLAAGEEATAQEFAENVNAKIEELKSQPGMEGKVIAVRYTNELIQELETPEAKNLGDNVVPITRKPVNRLRRAAIFIAGAQIAQALSTMPLAAAENRIPSELFASGKPVISEPGFMPSLLTGRLMPSSVMDSGKYHLTDVKPVHELIRSVPAKVWKELNQERFDDHFLNSRGPGTSYFQDALDWVHAHPSEKSWLVVMAYEENGMMFHRTFVQVEKNSNHMLVDPAIGDGKARTAQDIMAWHAGQGSDMRFAGWKVYVAYDHESGKVIIYNEVELRDTGHERGKFTNYDEVEFGNLEIMKTVTRPVMSEIMRMSTDTTEMAKELEHVRNNVKEHLNANASRSTVGGIGVPKLNGPLPLPPSDFVITLPDKKADTGPVHATKPSSKAPVEPKQEAAKPKPALTPQAEIDNKKGMPYVEEMPPKYYNLSPEQKGEAPKTTESRPVQKNPVQIKAPQKNKYDKEASKKAVHRQARKEEKREEAKQRKAEAKKNHAAAAHITDLANLSWGRIEIYVKDFNAKYNGPNNSWSWLNEKDPNWLMDTIYAEIIAEHSAAGRSKGDMELRIVASNLRQNEWTYTTKNSSKNGKPVKNPSSTSSFLPQALASTYAGVQSQHPDELPVGTYAIKKGKRVMHVWKPGFVLSPRDGVFFMGFYNLNMYGHNAAYLKRLGNVWKVKVNLTHAYNTGSIAGAGKW